MSSDNAQSAVTYTSISSNSDGPSRGISLMNAGELPEMDPYEEVAQQGQAHPLSPAYVEEPKPEDEDTKEPSKGSDETEPFEEDETAVTPPPPRHHGVRISVRPQTPMAASTQALIDAFTAGSSPFPLPPTSPAYVQAPLGHRTAMIRMRDDILEEDMPPRRRFVLTAPPPGPGHDTRTIARAADRAEDVGYVRALYAFEQRMMTSIEEVNLRVSYQAQVRRQESTNFYTQLLVARTDCRDIKLEINVVRGQRTAYETKLQEVHQAYLNSEAQNRALLERLETLETNVSHMEWQRQSAENLVVTQMMGIYALEARARTNTVEDASSSCVVGLSQWLEKIESLFHISGCAIDNQVKFATCTLLGAALTWWNGHVRTLGEIKKLKIKFWNLRVKGNDVATYTQRFQELALMCTKFLDDETEKVDKYISGLPDNIHWNVMSIRPKTLDETTELANNLMDQKQHTYAERQNDNKRKADDSSRNNQEQQPHKKQNVARAYTAGPSENKVYTRDLPLCTKCNYHHTRQRAPKYGKCKRYGHTTMDFRVNTNNNNNNNKNQKAKACYECELADGKIIGVNIIIRDCTLNFMNHPFNIDLMPVPLGSFDVIIGMDWLTKYHGVIICDEKIVHVPFGREMLIFQGNEDNQREESRLNIISCTKAQEYLSKGCDVFLAHITTKEAKEKSEGKRLKDVLIFIDFLEVFPEDLSGIPPARQVEFQIDLVLGAAPVVRAPYRLAPPKMKELAEQLQELSKKGFTRASSSP
uniref:Reverse transcriptase domain-containing protein n=1 Tax=Tanacetum cinerariifolium TaxID=118510 RepID=A0A6L2MRN0_TANCI|nr:reverse transcriptase domain-containing protein [Tanacetum cinerariifolium]